MCGCGGGGGFMRVNDEVVVFGWKTTKIGNVPGKRKKEKKLLIFSGFNML